MNITVFGLWHLGSVTAACLAAAGHRVIGVDPDAKTIAKLKEGQAPLLEPGLDDLLKEQLKAGRLSFTENLADATRNADIVWIAFDTPVDENDVADTGYVLRQMEAALAGMRDGAVLTVSSQMPVGSIGGLRRSWLKKHPSSKIEYACVPENLRLGKAIEVFMKPDRFVVGASSPEADKQVRAALAPITSSIVSMSLESAEMTKHAINAFLATSVVFANELAVLCEQVGADAKEVERGLKSEMRIGPHAYLSPGSAFAGGTLARDCRFLEQRGQEKGKALPLIGSVLRSNEAHKSWPADKLAEVLGSLSGKTIAVLGLTYKANTSTLRRSSSVETCRALNAAGARIKAYDPGVKESSPEIGFLSLMDTAEAAVKGADALLVQTQWPEFKTISAERLSSWLGTPVIVDPNGFLAGIAANQPRFRYFAIGRSADHAK